MSQKPLGLRSAEALKALIPVGSTVRLEPDVSPRDQYGRTLAYVWANGRMVNWVMVRSGWTTTITFPPNVQYVKEFASAAQKARGEKLGLWHDDGFACTPADHRKKRC
jgi:micrococcal nuclease